VKAKCSRKTRYMNHLFCEGKIRSRFQLPNGTKLAYYGLWRFHHRNGFVRELYRRARAGDAPAAVVFGVGNHELAAVRAGGTDLACPEECLCSAGFTDFFDTIKVAAAAPNCLASAKTQWTVGSSQPRASRTAHQCDAAGRLAARRQVPRGRGRRVTNHPPFLPY
jgi:hypothetical protein